MNILFVHDHRFYEQNGIYFSPKFNKDVWAPYVMNNNNVVVYARRTNKQCTQIASANRVSFVLSRFYSNGISAIRNYFKIRKELTPLVMRADKIIIRMPSVLGCMVASVAKKYHKNIMAEVVGSAFDSYWYYGSISGKLLAPMYHVLNKRAIKLCDTAIYVTQEYLQNKYPNDKEMYACSDAIVQQASDDVLLRRLNKIYERKDRLICGEIGNISIPYKGYEVMLKAMAVLIDKNIDIEYHIVGGGNPAHVLNMARKLGIDNRVFYDDVLDHAKIDEFFDKIDIYVHPSFTEGLPRVVIEAISRGCPCLTSDAGGTPELIQPQYIHNAGDYHKLANDIIIFEHNKNTMALAAKYNYHHSKLYDISVLAPKRLLFYKKFLAK